MDDCPLSVAFALLPRIKKREAGNFLRLASIVGLPYMNEAEQRRVLVGLQYQAGYMESFGPLDPEVAERCKATMAEARASHAHMKHLLRGGK